MKLPINTKKSLDRKISGTRLTALILTLVTLVVVFWATNKMFVPVDVVVMKKDVPTGQRIESSDLEIVKVAKRDKHPQAFSNVKEVIETEITPPKYAATDLFKGQQLIIPQTTYDPSSLKSALAGIQEDETVLQLNENQAYWPSILRDGDYVMIEAVNAELNYIEELGVARVVQDIQITDKSGILQVTSQPAKQNRQILITTIETEQKTLLAIHNADMVYLRPIHPKLAN